MRVVLRQRPFDLLIAMGSQSRDVGGSNVKEISYVATNMPNSLQENAMEQLASPTAANNAYAGLKTLSHRNSEKDSASSAELEMLEMR